jgi:hypothetical protein
MTRGTMASGGRWAVVATGVGDEEMMGMLQTGEVLCNGGRGTTTSAKQFAQDSAKQFAQDSEAGRC